MAKREERIQVVLLTGASTGIGLALAKRLSQTSYRLVLTARATSLGRFAENELHESDRILIRALDVSVTAEADLLMAELNACWGGVDILINNAGVAYRAVIEHLTENDEKDQFSINYLGPLHLIRMVLPGMRSRRDGYIINLSSVGGMMAMPTMGGYSASKFALEGATEALWYELRPWGIRVSLVEPGFVHSNSFQNARFTPKSAQARDNDDDPYHQYYTQMMAFITRWMRLSPTTPDHIAKRILGLMARRHPPLRVPATYDAIFFSLVRRILPARLYHSVCFHLLPKIHSWVKRSPD